MSELSAASGALLLAAGTLAGAINAVAGGGTLVTFPALLAIGLPPVVATASNAVAVWPGHALAAVSYRGELLRAPISRNGQVGLCVAGILGGAIGAALLHVVGNEGLKQLVPLLLALATLLFACGPALARTASLHAARASAALQAVIVFVMAIYGGFFGAGLGVMLMAVLLLLGVRDAQQNNALKNLVATAVTSSSVLLLAASGLVAWDATVVMLVGAFAGGFVGGRYAQRISAGRLRQGVVAVGVVLTAYYAWTYY